jgi:CDGSH-type Zn-finger protein
MKCQRHQYKLKKEGYHSTMTGQREKSLESLGFVWDSHKATWEERLNELIAFRRAQGHCNVPAKFEENPQLAIWVKCQRRQYKLFCDGAHSNITANRISRLVEKGFVWNPRRKFIE